MNTAKILKVLIALLVIIVAAALLINFNSNSYNSEPADQEEVLETNFIQTGNIVKDNPGLKEGVWYFIYEQFGSPALNLELNFASESYCYSGDLLVSCSVLETGQRVEVVGNIDNQIVTVKSIYIQ